MKTTNPPKIILFLACAVFLLLAGANAQDAPAPAAPPAGKPAVEKSLLDTFFAGGALMWPILACSIGTIAVGVFCCIQINQKKMMPKAQESAVSQYMQQRDPNAAYQLCQSQPSVFANTMCAALLKVNFERDLGNKSSMEQAAGETLMQEEQRLMIWVNYLNIFATIAPMLGLLGTVTGMIQSFDQLAAGRSEPSDLAGGIGEAMITTAGGLIVGIPAMFLFFYFRNLLQVAIGNIQKAVTFMIDVLSGELKLESAVHSHELPPEEPAAE
ncbi:MAG: MotA/TolQ/ExbB proton channel family protein [Chthoniobacterales bacterium]